jgi:hypothetical protein
MTHAAPDIYCFALINRFCHAEKVFKKMGFVIEKEDIEAIVNAERGAVERILQFLRYKLADFQARVANGAEMLSRLLPLLEACDVLIASGVFDFCLCF